MITEIAAPAPTVAEARAILRSVQRRVDADGAAYNRIRGGLNIEASRRALSELGFAILDWIDASVALAGAEDRQNAAWVATDRANFATSDPAHQDVERAWLAYNQARRGGDEAAMTAARAGWRAELITWCRNLNAARLTEDEKHAAELRQRLDESERLDPDFAEPTDRSQAQVLVRESRERERRAALDRDDARYSQPKGGWQRARPAGQAQSGRPP